MGSALMGAVLWMMILYPCWSPRMKRKRKAGKVSGNRAVGTGPSWEQDEPFAECFDSGEDDL